VTSDPKRLTVVGATDLERTLLQAARRERPSPELTARMAAGLGISAAAAVTAATAPAAAAAPVVAAKTSLAIWVPAGVLAMAVTAGVVGYRSSAAPERRVPARAHVAAPATPEAEAAAPVVAPAADARAERRIEKVRRRHVVAPPAPAGDLRDQIALIDAARTAVKAGATERALVLLRRYDGSYPNGAFRPEALALRIEALDEAGRGAEARALARDFLARYPQSPTADRVAKIAKKSLAQK
jgi:hypothetical protein